MGRQAVTVFAIFAIFVWVSPASAQQQVVVPRSVSDVVLDGVIESAEWADALRLGEGAIELLVQERAGVLEIALRTPPLLVASLCFARGDEVYVLHSSSAVGLGGYRRSGSHWQLVQPFEWRLRGADDRGASPGEQRDHMTRFGWVANTALVGAPGETEFRVSARFLEDDVARVAIGLLLQGDELAVLGWPIGPEADGCTERTTIAGPLQDRLRFVTERWLQLALQNGGK